MKQNDAKPVTYVAPSCMTLDIRPEGVLCESPSDTYSPDDLNEGLKNWFE